MRALRIAARLLRALVPAALLPLAACGGSSGDGAAANDPAAQVKWFADYANAWYLWIGETQPLDPAEHATPEAALEALRVPKDRYSYIESAEKYNAFFDEARSLGFGIGYFVGRSDLPLRLVQPDSPAAAAGLRRGDRIVDIDGESIASLLATNRLDAAFGPVTEGVTRRFGVTRGGQRLELTVTKGWYTVRNVLDARVIPWAGRRIGYIAFYAFTAPAGVEWRREYQALLDQGFDDLVVDLRDNGGGRLTAANDIASMLAPEGLSGKVSTRIAFNALQSANDQILAFGSDLAAGRVGKLAWITGPRTCSASEVLIETLAAWRSAVRVGEASCGKPVGFTPPQYGGKVYSLVTFSLRNALGVGDWFGGLTPDCMAGEDVDQPLGSPAEPKLAAALAMLAGQGCPASTAAKSAPDAPGQASRSPPAGIEGMTGLR